MSAAPPPPPAPACPLGVGPIGVGQEIGPLTLPPVSRLTLALYCGASGDHNPIHVDTDAARAAGLDDVIAHGMLAMAYLGRLLTGFVPQRAVRSFQCRFIDMVRVGDVPVCRGRVTDLFVADGERRARITLVMTDRQGREQARGEAIITLS
jgi:acyl dehydratase